MSCSGEEESGGSGEGCQNCVTFISKAGSCRIVCVRELFGEMLD